MADGFGEIKLKATSLEQGASLKKKTIIGSGRSKLILPQKRLLGETKTRRRNGV